MIMTEDRDKMWIRLNLPNKTNTNFIYTNNL